MSSIRPRALPPSTHKQVARTFSGKYAPWLTHDTRKVYVTRCQHNYSTILDLYYDSAQLFHLIQAEVPYNSSLSLQLMDCGSTVSLALSHSHSYTHTHSHNHTHTIVHTQLHANNHTHTLILTLIHTQSYTRNHTHAITRKQ